MKREFINFDTVPKEMLTYEGCMNFLDMLSLDVGSVETSEMPGYIKEALYDFMFKYFDIVIFLSKAKDEQPFLEVITDETIINEIKYVYHQSGYIVKDLSDNVT